MRFPLLVYLLLLAAMAGGVFFVVDRIVKVGTKGTDADISLGGIFFAGLLFTLVFAAVTITVFTGAVALFGWFLAALAAVLTVVYAWRVAMVARDRKLMAAMFAEEEAVVRAAAGSDPANAAAWLRLSELCELKGDYPAALKYCRKCCELEPTDANNRRLERMKADAVKTLRGIP